MKTIRINAFSSSELQSAITELNELKRDWKRKADICSEMIAAQLADIIDRNLEGIPYTDDLKDIKNHQEVPKKEPLSTVVNGNRILIQGQAVAFVEFGAGIYHNSGANNPLSQSVQFDTSIGSYGMGHGSNKYWFVAHNLISCGTPAYMPINNAIEEIMPMIPTMVRQVFI